MSREVVEVTIVIRTLPIFKTFEVNLTRLNFFSVVNFFASVGNIRTDFYGVKYIELKSPDNISRIFDAARFFERFK